MQSPSSVREITLALSAQTLNPPEVVTIPTGDNPEPYIQALRSLGIITRDENSRSLRNLLTQTLTSRGYFVGDTHAVFSPHKIQTLPQDIPLEGLREDPAGFITQYALHEHICICPNKAQMFNDLLNYLTQKGYALDNQKTVMRSYGLPVTVYAASSSKTSDEREDPVVSGVNEFLENPPTLRPNDWRDLAYLSVNSMYSPASYSHLSADAQLVVRVFYLVIRSTQKVLHKLARRFVNRHRDLQANVIRGIFQSIVHQPQTFIQHQNKALPPETTDNALDLLEDGYDIQSNSRLTEQALIQLSDGHSTAFVNDGQLYLKTLSCYPGMVTKTKEYLPHIYSSLAWRISDYMFSRTPSAYERWYLIIVGYPTLFPDLPDTPRRLSTYKKLQEVYANSLIGLYIYIYRHPRLDLQSIARLPEDPLALYLIRMSEIPIPRLPELIKGIGMTVPPYLEQVTYVKFILSQLADYSSVIRRVGQPPSILSVINEGMSEQAFTKQMSIYTDDELMQIFGYLHVSIQRPLRIMFYYRLLTRPSFMLLPSLDQRATNEETTLLTPVKDIPGPYLVFGTPMAYRVYELEEISSAFDEENLRIPEVPHTMFTPHQYFRLYNLIRLVKSYNRQLENLAEGIRETMVPYINMHALASYEVITILKDTLQDSHHAELVKELFWKIFYAGMYMRRWRGPGTEYPILATATHSTEVDPMPQSLLTLGEISQIMDTLEKDSPPLVVLLKDLRIVIFQNNGLPQGTTYNLLDTLAQISAGEYCIRSASTGLIQTAYVYLDTIYNERIPGIIPQQIERIS